MRLGLLVLIIVAGLVIYFKAPVSSQSARITGDVLGTTLETVKDTVTQIVPPQVMEKLVTETSSNVINRIQGDVNTAVSQTVNVILAKQLTDNFKNLPQPVREQVKQNICK